MIEFIKTRQGIPRIAASDAIEFSYEKIINLSSRWL